MDLSWQSRIERPLARSDVLVHAPEAIAWRIEDLWDAWRFAQAEAELTLREWIAAAAGTAQAGDAFAAYRASVDREEQAAAVLAALARPPRF